MGRGKPVSLETISFDTRALALEFFKAMLNRYIPGETVSNEDTPHLAALFKQHPDYLAKVGCGVAHFEVMPGDYGSQCFCAVRNDGSREEFSYKRCVTQKKD
jgi:hypothetical protein